VKNNFCDLGEGIKPIWKMTQKNIYHIDLSHL